jgi:hypothetical protein
MLGGTVSLMHSQVADGEHSFQMLSTAVNMTKSRGQPMRGVVCLGGWTAGLYLPAAVSNVVTTRLTHGLGPRRGSNTYIQIVPVVNILLGCETSGENID